MLSKTCNEGHVTTEAVLGVLADSLVEATGRSSGRRPVHHRGPLTRLMMRPRLKKTPARQEAGYH